MANGSGGGYDNLFRDLKSAEGHVTKEAVGFPYVESITTLGAVTYRDDDGDNQVLQLGDVSHGSVSAPDEPYAGENVAMAWTSGP